MKKLVLFLAAVTVLTAAAPSRAADITIGANTWYSWWDMDPKDSPDKFEYDPAFLYGPALAVKFTDNYTLNMVFLYGEFDGDYKVYFTGPGWQTIPSKTKRYDSDTSLSYRLNDYFKLFAGVKVTGYTFETDAVPAYSMPAVTVKNTVYGPAAGVSGVFPIANSFFMLANGSVMYLFGESDNSVTGKSDVKCPGFNASASLAYYIPSASVTLSFGGRYQYLKWDAVDNNGTDANHQFYGITAAANYSFSL